jgi:outer membrane protein OmpA-like peptidoglycan-associated protein
VGESVRIRAIASDPNNDPLTYTWTIAGERVAATGTEVVFGSAGRTPGDYSVNVRVSDGEMAATDTATVKVLPLPNKPPSVSCTVAKAEVMAGERVGVQAQGKDPDNDPLSYQWTSTGGRIEGSGTQVDLDTTGLSAGSYVITVRISDGRGGTASSTCSVHVRERIRILIDRYKVDNVGKAILDDVALKLKGDARILATITGYGDDRGTPKAQDKAALDRAEDVKKYLVEKHKIDAGRLTVKSGGSSDPVAPNTTAAGRKQNRRAEIELYVP